MDLYAILGAIGAAIATVLFAFLKGQKAGRDSVAAEQTRKDNATRAEYEKIDAAAPDLDASLDRLQQRGQRSSTKTK